MSTIKKIDTHIFHTSPKTNWIFISVIDSNGVQAWGEASLIGWEPILKSTVDYFATDWIGLSLDQAQQQLHASPRLPGGLVVNTVISAAAQAVSTLQSVHQNISACQVLGKTKRSIVPLYANINRATTLRTPQGFVQTANRAKALGYTRFKAAPFDGLMPHLCHTDEGKKRIAHGIDCMLALRDALGPDALLMVDCHWRFDESHAIATLKNLQPAKLHWFECPIGETYANWNATRRIRGIANDQGVLLAAAESQMGIESFQNLFDEKLLDVVMPDIKYCGGPWEMLQIAERAQDSGVQFSPHNPSGPICTWHSLQVSAVAPQCDMLEIQFEESDDYDLLQTGAQLIFKEGAFLVPDAPALMPKIDMQLLNSKPYQKVPPGVETLLNR
ncbi:MAG: enolase C-terminal domain-like protein [Burkholderiaceae bacterium]